MKNHSIAILLAMVAALTLASWDASASDPFGNLPVQWSMRPVTPFTQPGEMALELRIEITSPMFLESLDSTFDMYVVTEGRLNVISPERFVFSRGDKASHSEILRVMVPNDDTCSIRVYYDYDFGCDYPGCKGLALVGCCYFVTTGDSCEYWKGRPQLTAKQHRARMPRDTALYRVRVDLRSAE